MNFFVKMGLSALKDKETRKKLLLIIAPVAFFMIIMPAIVILLLLAPIMNGINAITSLKAGVSSFFEKFGNLMEGREFAIIDTKKVEEQEQKVYAKLNDVYEVYLEHGVTLDAPLILSTIYYPMTIVYDENTIADMNDMANKSEEELANEEAANNEKLYDYYKRITGDAFREGDIPKLARNSISVTTTEYECNKDVTKDSEGKDVVNYTRGDQVSSVGPEAFDGNFKESESCNSTSNIKVYTYQADKERYDAYLRTEHIASTPEYQIPSDLEGIAREKRINSTIEGIHDLSKMYYDFFNNTNTYTGGVSALCLSGVMVTAGSESTTTDSGVFGLEEYVAGVITHENLYSQGDNIEAMKAQAIAARTYVLNRTNYCSKPIANGQGSQTFYADADPRAIRAAKETEGLVLTYNGEIFSSEYDAFYCVEVTVCPIDGMCSCEYMQEPVSIKHTVSIPYSYAKSSSGGHGRGMSQLAARYLQTDLGYNYEQILKYFYSPGVEISKSFAAGKDGLVTFKENIFTIPDKTNSGIPGTAGNGKYQLNIYFWEMLNKFLTAAGNAGYKIGMTDGWRSYDQQVTCKKEKPTLCATPGKSMHGWGIAADLDYYKSKAATDWAHTHATEYGLKYTVCHDYFGNDCKEPWHIEPINIEYR